ncbi:unnamed protein product [Rotaria sordida]|uniref:TTF-type domain-containing protein n=1 Tax=Rotaria sordida TaxID=392033 RepID=A0A815B2Y1_9BILA|nr:unnamed protein product [Rotaria sordida]CAF1266498.1 unnamed protein product [Rotaria sordida]CAF1273918.1 unnamed protein product [Rotaria sordida]CAF1318185.1 unnamed protein product [Rotaria sordida]CAF1531892.1 unnamed protein product [Rotaria sordida]
MKSMKKITDENVITATPSGCEPLNNYLKNDSLKRDSGPGPATAKDFVLLGPYQPNINFPTTNHRHFCYTWYQRYNWLEFSEMIKKAHCFVCRFAYVEGRFEKEFTIDGFNNWPMAIVKFNKHQAAASHNYANDLWVNAVKNYKTIMMLQNKLIDNMKKKL